MNKTPTVVYVITASLVAIFTLIGIYYYVDNNYDLNNFFSEKQDIFVDEETEEVMRIVREEVDSIIGQYNQEAAPEVATDTYDLLPNTNEGDLGGTIVLSGVKNGESIPQVYGLDVGTQGSGFQIMFDEVADKPHMTGVSYDGSLDTDGRLFTLIYTGEPDDFWQVALVDRGSGEVKTLSSTEGDLERNFDWSADMEHLALQRAIKGTKYSQMLGLDNWEIIVVNPEIDAVVASITGGSQPRWVSGTDGFVYLKEDGLYFYDFNSRSEDKLYGIEEGRVLTTSMIDVSPDGNYLVWSTAKQGLISLFGIDKTSVIPELKPIGQISNPDLEYYWPTFSPDSAYFAIQSIGTYNEEAGSRLDPAMEVFDLSTGELVYSKSLEEFNFDALFVDDWIR